MEYYFKTEKLSVGYHGCPLIEEIEFGINKGEILTLIGPNGAGKSTILRSIARQLEPLGGAVYMENRDLAAFSRQQLSKSMSVVLTDKIRTELMTCEDVIEMGRYPYTGRFGVLSKEDHRAVEEAMELVHVTELRDQDFSKISDGQRQRVMLAKGLCQEPDIIVLDEPTSYLDVKYKLEFLSILQELRKQKNITVIMSLHELDLAERVSDKILCINGKYVERFGTPEEIFEEGYISKLFHITSGTFDETTTGMELKAAEGSPKVFVIAGGGTGRRVFRYLQRAGISFATGILYENDLDYPVAKALAGSVIGAAAFEPVCDALLDEAKKSIQSCEKIICTKEHFAALEKYNEQLLEYAKDCEKDIEIWQK